MTEIEKMFENANAYKMLCNCEFKNLFDYSIDYGQDVCIHAEDEICKGCEGCKLAEQNVKYYPPFTAEKQLELIKWLAHKDYDKDALLININASNYTYFSLGINSCDDGNGLYEDYCFGSKQFDEALAGVVNLIWQSLTEEEKQQVKGILE